MRNTVAMEKIECISFRDLMDMEFPQVPERPMTAADVATMEDLTWTALVERQPLLAELAHRCASADSGMNEHFCANELWYNQFKPKLLELVGWEADTMTRCSGPTRRTSLPTSTVTTCFPGAAGASACSLGPTSTSGAATSGLARVARSKHHLHSIDVPGIQDSILPFPLGRS
jgi:hypothetical protein